ncbi:MAG: rhodanese-like domain-containing protein, partial [Acidimicrobiia bacterium]
RGAVPRESIDDLLNEARSRIERLTPGEARAAMDDGAMLVDTRCNEDRRSFGVVPGSVHIPRTVLEWRADPDSDYSDPRISAPGARLIIMCMDGFSSSLAAASLTDLGCERVADMEGGFRAWKAAGLPVQSVD